MNPKLEETIRSALRGAEADKQADRDTSRSLAVGMIFLLVAGAIAAIYVALWPALFLGAVIIATKVVLAFPAHRKWLLPVAVAVLIPLGILAYHLTLEAAGDVHEFFTKEKAQRARADARSEWGKEQNRRANGAIEEGEKHMRADRAAGTVLRRDHWTNGPNHYFGRFVPSWNDAGIRPERFNVTAAYSYAFGRMAEDYGMEPSHLPKVIPDGLVYARDLGEIVKKSWTQTELALQAWAVAAFMQRLDFSPHPSADAITQSVAHVREVLKTTGFEKVGMSGAATLGQWLEKRLPIEGPRLRVSPAYAEYLSGTPQSSDAAIAIAYLVHEARQGHLPTLAPDSLVVKPFAYAKTFRNWRASADFDFNQHSLKYQKRAFEASVRRVARELAQNSIPLDRAEKQQRLLNRFRSDRGLSEIQKLDPTYSLAACVDAILDDKPTAPSAVAAGANLVPVATPVPQVPVATTAPQQPNAGIARIRSEALQAAIDENARAQAEREAKEQAKKAEREMLRLRRDFVEAWLFRRLAQASNGGARPDVTKFYNSLAVDSAAAGLPEALGFTQIQFAQFLKGAADANISDTGKVTLRTANMNRLVKAGSDRDFMKLALYREREGLPENAAEMVKFLDEKTRLLPRIESMAFDLYHPEGWHAQIAALHRRMQTFIKDVARDRGEVASNERTELIRNAARNWPEVKKLEKRYPARFSLEKEIAAVTTSAK